jgi:hypothetical protein
MTYKDIEISVTLDKSSNSVKTDDKSLSIKSKSCTKNSIFSQNDSLSNQNLISRKTNRGRKEKNKFDNNQPKCEVCLEFAEFSKETLISCSICNCFFHKSCFNQYEEITSSDEEVKYYRCIRCTHALNLNKNINEFKCFICFHSNSVLKFNRVQGIYYHQICLDNLPELNCLPDEEITKDKIKKWRYKNSCKFCGKKLSKNIAVTKCKNPKCKEHYHIPCAIEKGLIFDLDFMKKFYHVDKNNQIPFYCSNHNKKIYNQYKNYIKNLSKLNGTSYIEKEKESIYNEETKLDDEYDKDDIEDEKKGINFWKKYSSEILNKENDECYEENEEEYKEDEEFDSDCEEKKDENLEINELNESFDNSKENFLSTMKKICVGIDCNILPIQEEFKSKKKKNYISFNTIFECFNRKKTISDL